MKALTCPIQALQKFASGLANDYAVVKASMMVEVSNGPVEGQQTQNAQASDVWTSWVNPTLQETHYGLIRKC